jgi:hypothetical protein
MAKLVMLQLVQPVSARFMTRGPINQEVGAPPLLGFLHTMLSVKRVKDNMRLTFIKKLLLTAKLGPACKQNICVSKVCYTRAKAICVTLVMFSYGKF